MAFYITTPIRFKCTQCSQCCYGGKYAYVRANDDEIKAIVDYLQIDKNQFTEKYLIKLVDHGYGIKMKTSQTARLTGKKGHCMLLNNKGKCSVYPVRPIQCRTYPFWPEILSSEQYWNDEVTRCEGINQGEVIDVDYIEQQKALSFAAEVIINK